MQNACKSLLAMVLLCTGCSGDANDGTQPSANARNTVRQNVQPRIGHPQNNLTSSVEDESEKQTRAYQRLNAKPGVITPSGTEKTVSWCRLSPDAQTVYAAADSQIASWSVTDEKPKVREGVEFVLQRKIALSSDGAWLAVGHDTGIDLRSTDTFAVKHTLQTPSSVEAIAYSPDNAHLAAGLADGNIQLFNVSTRTAAFRLKASDRFASTFAFRGSESLISASGKELTIWDLKTQTAKNNLKLTVRPRALVVCPDTEKLVTLSFSLDVWNLEDGARIWKSKISPYSRSELTVSPDGSKVAFIDLYGYLVILDTTDGNILARVQAHNLGSPSAHPIPVQFSADGKSLVSATRFIRIWDLERLLDEPESYQIVGDEEHSLTGLAEWPRTAFSPDDKALAAGAKNRAIVWRLPDFKQEHAIDLLKGDSIADLAFSPDGEILALSDRGTRLALWYWKEEKVEESKHNEWRDAKKRRRLSYVNGSNQLLISLDKSSILYDIPSASTVRSFEKEGMGHYHHTVLSNKKMIVSAGEDADAFQIWDMEDGSLIRTIAGPDDIDFLTSSPDGSLIAVVGEDRTTILDAETFARLPAWQDARLDSCRCVAISPDNRLMAAGRGGIVEIFKIADGSQVDRLHGHTHEILSIAFTGNGKYLATGSRDATVKIWNLEKLGIVADGSGS